MMWRAKLQLKELSKQFDVITDPSEHADVEFLLKAKIEAGEAETGLYDLGTVVCSGRPR